MIYVLSVLHRTEREKNGNWDYQIKTIGCVILVSFIKADKAGGVGRLSRIGQELADHGMWAGEMTRDKGLPGNRRTHVQSLEPSLKNPGMEVCICNSRSENGRLGLAG